MVLRHLLSEGCYNFQYKSTNHIYKCRSYCDLNLKESITMKLNFNKKQCFTVPEAFYRMINKELEPIKTPSKEINTIILNFRDPNYSPKNGGFHPVEARLERRNKEWQIVYITDFSYQGLPYPELVVDIDVCFISKEVFSLFCGWLQNKSAKELLDQFVGNFIEYYSMGSYQVSVSFD